MSERLIFKIITTDDRGLCGRNFPLVFLATLMAFFLADIAFARDPLSGPAAAIKVEFTADNIAVTAISGFSNRHSGRALTADDPVRIASVSKFYVGLAVMRLVEAGKLDLHADANQYLSWNLRNPTFPDQPISLADLLSHQSGLRDGIDYALPMDSILTETLRNPAAWNDRYPPGHYFSYANLNFPVIAAIMEAATGKRFDRIMQEEVFQPLQLDACFNWINCSDARIAAAVTLYRPDGTVARDDLRGVRETCPTVPASDGGCDLTRYRLGMTGSIFSPQGGLRISAIDLAKTGQMLLRRGAGYLKPESFAALSRPLWRYDGKNGDSENGYFCAYGLAVHFLATSGRPATCQDDPFGDGKPRFGHSGEAYSLKSGLWVDLQDQHGVAFYRTEVPDDESANHCIYRCN